MDVNFHPNLHQNARQNFIEWRSTVIEAYGQSCNVYIRNGLLGFLLSDAAWALLPGNTIVEDAIGDLPAVITIVPRPILPQFTPLAPAATAVQQAAWDRNIKIMRYTRENYDMLKLKLISSILPEDIAAIRDPIMAFLHISPQTILAHVTTIHGTLDNSDYAQLTAILSTAMATNDTISGIVARHRHIHEQFSTSSQALSEYQKCNYFKTAVIHHQQMRAAYDTYLVSTPLVGDQTFTTLTAHIIMQAPNFTATASQLGYSASAQQTDFFQSPAFAALLTRTVQQAIDAPTGKARATAGGTKTPNHYCYVHGYNNSHNGNACLKMRADTETYTAVHLQAATPTTVPNGSTATPGAYKRNNTRS